MKHRLFSIRPAITLRGRTFKGLRGWAGKPLHPPLTDVPIGAYVLVAAFDLVSYVLGADAQAARDAYVAGTWALAGGAIVSLGAALTGFWDWLRSTPKYTQAWRTANWHMAVMLTATVVVGVHLAVRLSNYDASASGLPVLALSLVGAGLVAFGATYGGSLTYDYGFNVENATSTPAWKPSEQDVFPGDDESAVG